VVQIAQGFLAHTGACECLGKNTLGKGRVDVCFYPPSLPIWCMTHYLSKPLNLMGQ